MVMTTHCNVAAARVGAMTTSAGRLLIDLWSKLLGGDAWGVWSRRVTLEKRIVHVGAAVVINEAQLTQLMHRSLT